MRISRKRLVSAGAACGAYASIGVLRWPGEAAQFTLKVANDQTPTHPMNVATAAAIKRIADATGGAVSLTLFPNSMLGSDPQMMAQARSGAIEILQLGNNVLGAIVPAAALLSIPFAFTSSKQFLSCANGPLGAYIGAAAAKTGLHQFAAAFYGGFFQIQNRLRPINVPADLAGLKIRVPPGSIDVGTFKALGAAPTVVSLAEVYTSLQTHLVDGIEVPLPTVSNFKFYEQVKYCAITNHSGLAYFTFANPDAWQRLPKAFGDIVEHEFAVAASNAAEGLEAQEVSVESTLTSLGMVFNRPALRPFGDVIRSAGLYREWRDRYDPKGWELLEQTAGAL